MYKICLDPGHGGKDPGAIHETLIEKDINLRIALNCSEILRKCNIEVKLTRESDEFVELEERANMANDCDADYCISIHCNAGGGDRGEVIYSVYKGKGVELAKNIGDEIRKVGQPAIKLYNRINKEGKDYHAIIRETKMSTVIVECAFLDHKENSKLVNSDEKQEQFGVAIARGIIKQLKIQYK